MGENSTFFSIECRKIKYSWNFILLNEAGWLSILHLQCPILPEVCILLKIDRNVTFHMLLNTLGRNMTDTGIPIFLDVFQSVALKCEHLVSLELFPYLLESILRLFSDTTIYHLTWILSKDSRGGLDGLYVLIIWFCNSK